MKKTIVAILAMLALAAGSTVAGAATINLYEWASYVDGPVLNYGPNGDPITFGPLGTKTFTVTGGGQHNVLAFFDHEITETSNTFFNEYGLANGLPVSKTGLTQSWEIDEPGYVFGDIYSNFVAGTLDNSNGVPAADDVSMALGWKFDLLAGETATINFILSTVAPSSGFYLGHFDNDAKDAIYFSSTFDKGDQPPPVPEPSTIILLGAGLAGLGIYRRRSAKR